MRKSEGGGSPVPKRSRFNGRINRRLLSFSSRVLRSLSPVGGLTRRQPPPPVQTVGKAALAEWWYEGSDQNHVRNFGEPVAGYRRYESTMQTLRFRSVSPPTARHHPLRPRHHTPEPLGRHPKTGGLVHVDGGDSDQYEDDDGYDGSEEEFEEDVPVDEEDLDSEPEVESDDDDDDANWQQGKNDDEKDEDHILDPNDVVVESESEGTEDESSEQDESTDEEEDWPEDDSDYHP